MDRIDRTVVVKYLRFMNRNMRALGPNERFRLRRVEGLARMLGQTGS